MKLKFILLLTCLIALFTGCDHIDYTEWAHYTITEYETAEVGCIFLAERNYKKDISTSDLVDTGNFEIGTKLRFHAPCDDYNKGDRVVLRPIVIKEEIGNVKTTKEIEIINNINVGGNNFNNNIQNNLKNIIDNGYRKRKTHKMAEPDC